MDATQRNELIDTIERGVEGAVGATAFHPLIATITALAIEHFTKTGEVPTEAELVSQLSAEDQAIVAGWATYTPSGDGSLAP